MFEFNLSQNGSIVHVQNYSQLQEWARNEMSAWQWLNLPATEQSRALFQKHQRFINEVKQIADNWQIAENQRNAVMTQNVFKGLQNAFQRILCPAKNSP